MDSNKEIELLKKALKRQKKARQQAEKILEQKSKELYDVIYHLKQTNSKLENLINEKTSELDGVFINIIDPYVVMDLQLNVINMNASAKEFLECDHSKYNVNLASFVHPAFEEYARESMQSLLKAGTLKNFRAKILIRGKEKWVEINASIIFDKNKKVIAAQGIIRDITTEMEIKELFYGQKRQLDIIFDNSPVGIILTKKNKIIRSNRTFLTMLGFSANDVNYKSIEELYEPLDPEETHSLIDEKTEGTLERYNDIKRFFRKDGTPVLVKTKINTVVGFNGTIEYQVAIFEDISKERAKEQKIRESESRLTILLSNLHSGVLLEDENRTIALTNERFVKLFQIPYSPEQLIGADCSTSAEQNKTHFKDPTTFVKRINTILEQKKTVLSEELEMVDGRILERDYIPVFSQGVYKGHLWAYHDVTIEKHYEKGLEAEREKYSSIISKMNLGLLEVDNNDVVQMVNQSFCDLAGVKEDELVGKVASDIIKLKKSNFIFDKNTERLQGKSGSYEVEVYSKEGTPRHWIISGAPRYDEAHNVIGSIGIHLDITAQRQLELELKEAIAEIELSSHSRELFFANISHDMRTPLNVIIGAIAELSNERSGENHDLVDNALRASNHLLSLVNNVLDMAMINAGKITSNTMDFELSRVLFDTVAILRSTVEADRPVEVRLTVEGGVPEIVSGDKYKVEQILMNLIGNAVKFTLEGLVEVVAELVSAEGDGVVIGFSVSDTGIGMHREFMQHIFTEFERDFNKNGQAQGSGLGLAISNELVCFMGGELQVDSELGKGTRVYFELPLQRVRGVKHVDSAGLDKFLFKDRKILLAEDNTMNQALVKRQLGRYGAKIILANNGREALEVLESVTPDIILMDIQMPVMDGVECTQHVRERFGTLQLPILALTANAFKNKIDEYLAQGMDGYIIKPYTEEVLVKKIMELLNISRQKAVEPSGGEIHAPDAGCQLVVSNIRAMSGDDEDFFKELLSTFRKLASETLTDMHAAIGTGDIERVSRLAHKIKPSLKQLQLYEIQNRMLELEHKEHSLEGARRVFADIENGLNGILSRLEELN